MDMTSSPARVQKHNRNNNKVVYHKSFLVLWHLFTMGPCGQPMSAAQRRLRSWWRHEQQCGPGHAYSPLSPTGTEEGQGRGGGERVALHSRGQEDSSPAGALQPVRRRVPQRTVEPMLETFVPVPSLDAPVPQPVGQLVQVLTLIDTVVPEQVIDVPKITSKTSSRSALCSACRRWGNSWWTSPRPPSTTSSLLRKKRRRSSRVLSLSRTSGTLLVVSGAGSSVRRGSTGGWWAHPLSSGPFRRGTPPAQGGI